MSLVFYRGPSVLDGEPIVGVATGFVAKSRNPKTGPMIQTWILRRDKSPTDAIIDGSDYSICGDCKLRGDGKFGRACYVTWWQGPLNVWRAFSSYPLLYTEDLRLTFMGASLRLGAYGDPAAIPFGVWEQMLTKAHGWVGYTHQWKTCDPRLKQFCMASVDTSQEREEASALGWRTFRCRPIDGPLLAREVICPASDEAGHKTTCEKCQLCRGTSRPAKDIVIQVHGPRTKWFASPRLGATNQVRWIGKSKDA